jgi:hypothetical protein
MSKMLYCPTCQEKVHFHLDEWGRTPWHLHCENCNINIGMNYLKKAEELLQKYHSPNTWIEYYENVIQILNINGEYIINKTEA